MKKLNKENIEDILGLVPMQEGMLFHYLKDPGSDYYFEQLNLGISGNIDKGIFEKAWGFVIETNEMLRALFRWENVENPVQIILKEHWLQPRYHDFTGITDNEKQNQLKEVNVKDRKEKFDLREVPFRVTLCKVGKDKYELIISNHHILYDGWSTGIILKEFFKAYHTLSKGEQLIKPTDKTPLKEYIKWIQNRDRNRQERFWQEYLDGLDTLTALPIKRRKGEAESGESVSLILAKDITGKLDVFVNNNRVTLAAVFYTTWGILLQKYCSSEDVIFGTTVSGRYAGIKGIGEMVGLFINTLPLRVRSGPGAKIIDVLTGIEVQLREREEFENTPLVDIGSYSPAAGGGSLFATMVAIENYPLDNRLIPEDSLLSVHSYAIGEMTQYDLSVGIFTFKGIEIKFSYNRELFDKDTIENLAGHFKGILRNIIGNPEAMVSQLEIISSEEKNRILYEFNNTAAEYPAHKTIHRLFQKQEERTPDHLALLGAHETHKKHEKKYNMSGMSHLSYKELNEKSNQLAYFLIKKGVTADNIVGIMVEPSLEMTIAILAILKSGGAYLPIDPDYPQERIGYMLKDSSVSFLVKKSNNFSMFTVGGDIDIISIDEVIDKNHPKGAFISPSTLPPFYPSNPSSLAYVIYTSGSTGRPRGVMVNHSSLVNLCTWHNRYYSVTARDRASKYAAVGFDASVWEIFPYLITGASLCLVPDEIKLDMAVLNCFFETHCITIAFLPTPVCEGFMEQENHSLRALLTGGDRLKNFIKRNYQLFNNYGPTENTVVTTAYPVNQYDANIPIGKPIHNNLIFIMNPGCFYIQPIGVPGELCIGGDNLARGYLNNPGLTAERFRLRRPGGSFCKNCPLDPRKNFSLFSTHSSIYKTGDQARWHKDGNIEFLGRIDFQVKIRGYRIELGEIEERLLKHKRVKAAVATATGSNIPILCAYIVLKNEDTGTAEKAPDAAELREYLCLGLPGYMIPDHFYLVEKIPLTPTGKLDRIALQASNILLGTGVEYVSPKNDIEKTIAGVWQDLLGLDKVGIHDNFFDLGGNSLSVIRLTSRLREALPDKKDISVVTLFNHPTVSSLARYLNREEQEAAGMVEPGKTPSRFEPSKIEIAVIGMAGRFPGAKDIDEFWNNIKNGVESIRFFRQEQLKQLGVEPRLMNDPAYVPAKGVLEGKEYFDSLFFDYTPVEAGIMDPQVRIFHEIAWEALEHAGYDPVGYNGAIGLYAGASPNPLWAVSPLTSGAVGGSYPEMWNAIQFSDKDYLGTRIAYKLDLKGPCVTLQTACSTSLAAVDQACRALVSGACSMALAGGVSVTFQDEGGYLYQEGTIMSPDGHCRAFAANAKGTVGGNGAGIVVLKRLDAAAAEGDTIYAVIKGFAINNDGKNKVGFTAPGSKGQAKVIRDALEMAGFTLESIGYVEAHGTGTLLGDPIEIEGLKLAFNAAAAHKKNYCAIGSVKTNIGHLDAAAGIAGLIKTVLSLHHRFLPPSLHFSTPNPQIDLENSPFYVNTGLKAWQSNENPLRAGVSSFGLGGTNVHVILEEAPAGHRNKRFSGVQGAVFQKSPLVAEGHLLLWSAKTPRALEKMTENLAGHFKRNPQINFADAAYTLQVGRRPFIHRKMLVGKDAEEALRKLKDGEVETAAAKEEKHTIVFMFSGQGSQYVNMGLDLYKSEPVFRHQIDECFELLKNIVNIDMKPVLYPGEGTISEEEAGEKIFQFRYTTPVKFIFEYSLARLLLNWGIKPDAMMGHSFGEYVAACLAGVFSLEDGLYLAALRGELMDGLADGAMLSVPLPEKQLEQRLAKEDELCIAAVNAQSLCVVSGPGEAVNQLEKQLNREGYECLRLRVPKAGHSRMVEPIMKEFQEKIRKVKFHKPRIPFISCLTGAWITDRQAVDPGYWTRHLRAPVRFADGLTTLFKEPNPVFLQASPGKGLNLFIEQHPDRKSDTLALGMVRHRKEPASDRQHTLAQIGRLWLNGCPTGINWHALHEGEKRQRIPLPSYPFEGKYYPASKEAYKIGSDPGLRHSTPLLTRQSDMADWFYIPVWEQAPGRSQPAEPQDSFNWLLFADQWGLADRIAAELRKTAREVVIVKTGKRYTRETANEYRLNPTRDNDYKRLFHQLAESDQVPRQVIHLWNVNPDLEIQGGMAGLDRVQELGLYSLLNIVQALGQEKISSKIKLNVVTNNMQSVIGDEDIRPEKATIRGAVKIIPLEYVNMSCTSIDILWSTPGTPISDRLFQLLYRELTGDDQLPGAGSIVALRGSRRWCEKFKPIRLGKNGKKMERLKKRGVYLITGGFGGMGFTFAQHMAENFQARLVLVQRSFFPGRQEWPRWLAEQPGDDPVGMKIRKIQQWEQGGAEIMVCRADVSNQGKMKKVIARVHRRFGPINGVLHTAGLGDYAGMIQHRTREMTGQVMAPKVKGTWVLETVLKEDPLDFLVLFSSIGNIIYQVKFAQVGYNAANEFLEAFAHYKNRQGGVYTVTISWSDWLEVGMAIEATERKYRKYWKYKIQPDIKGIDFETAIHGGFTPGQGVEVFMRILESGLALERVALSMYDLPGMFRVLENLAEKNTGTFEAIEQHPPRSEPEKRPPLATPYLPPANRLEQTLSGIWSNYFGIETIGTKDDFFELGGDSLKAMIMIQEIHKVLGIRIPLVKFFNNPTVRGQAAYIGKTGKKTCAVLPLVEEKEYYPLSSAQQRIYILQGMEAVSTAYHITHGLKLTGEIHKERIAETFRRLIGRHESLRTSFEMLDGKPVQRIRDRVEFEIEYYNIQVTGAGDRCRSKQEPPQSKVFAGGQGGRFFQKEPPLPPEAIIKNFIRPFDLSQAPLLRVGLIKLAPREYILIGDMHHIVTDGTSVDILIKEFSALYMGQALPGFGYRYKDYTQWQIRQRVENREEIVNKQEDYWLERLWGELPVLELPIDYPRPAMQSFTGSSMNFKISERETNQLKKVALARETTLFTVLLAVCGIWLSRLSGQEDIIIGSVTAGRKFEELQSVIGMFVNTLPLRSFPNGEKTFNQFLEEVRDDTLKDFENQDYPFEALVEKKVSERETGRNPLFDIMYILQTRTAAGLTIPGLTMTPIRLEPGISMFDLSIEGVEEENKLQFTLEYCNKLFKRETIRRLSGYFTNTISAVIASHDIRIAEIDILDEKEKNRLLYEFNETAVEYPKDKTIHRLFEEQVEQRPNQVALVGPKLQNPDDNPLVNKESRYRNNYESQIKIDVLGEIQLSYSLLNETSNRLTYILKKKGVRPGTIVGIMVERSVEMVVGIMGILKAGGAYLPIDPAYPQERIDYMLKDSGTKILLTGQEIAGLYSPQVLYLSERHQPIFPFSQLPNFPASFSSSLAYILYTSGSTGKPKGVMITHRSVVNRLYFVKNNYRLDENDVVLQKTSFTFDVSVCELFRWFAAGAKLCLLAGSAENQPAIILNTIAKHQVTTIDFAPSMFRVFLELMTLDNAGAQIASLRWVFIGAEVVQPELVTAFNKAAAGWSNARLINAYGPTEATVDVTYFNCTDGAHKFLSVVPIGKPMANVRVYILDRAGYLQAIKIAGELCIGGDCLALGYLNNPQLTAERFCPWQPGGSFRENALFPPLDPRKSFSLEGTRVIAPLPDRKMPGKKVYMQPCSHAFMQLVSHPSHHSTTHHSPLTIYRTGDLARWKPDGNIEFMGRLDHQVKIRGFRIELEEIENQLLTHERIKNAVVAVKTGKREDRFLCAFLEANQVTGELTALELRSFLSTRLPGYMIPAYFTQLEHIPLTPNGKVDRRALPEPGLTGASQYAAPRDRREALLVNIWEQVLGKDHIGIDDNFFTIGGDSIKTLQIAARVRNSGYNLEMKDIFREPTVARLAPLLKKIQGIPPQETVTGSVPLTPIQLWFFENHFTAGHHYNQSIMFYWREGVEPEALEAIFTQLQRHHDALRMTFGPDNGNIRQCQYNHGQEYPRSLTVYDFRGWTREKALAAMEQKAEAIQASIDLEKGPLLKTALFKMEEGDRLLIAVHHLVIDGVSWRILFEDIENLYQQYQTGRPLTLPLKTDSFKTWAERLYQYADSPVFLKEKTYWQTVENHVIPAIDKDFAVNGNQVKDARTIAFHLSQQETNLLLTNVNHAFGTEIDDILLTALALSVRRTFGNEKLLVAMEGHGREEILEDIDISRTIGWFTSLYPVVLDISCAADTGRQIKEIKETLRKVPNKGIGYGILRYLTKEENKKEIEFKLTPQISFNYLGQFDADIRQRSFTVSQESCGHTVSPQNRRENQIEISALITARCLALNIIYNKKHFKPGTMEKFRDNYQSALRDSILYCQSRKKRELTPADLTYPGLSIEKLGELQEQYALEDICILSPMQEGKLFYTFYRQHSPAGIAQMRVLISGKLNLSLFQKSLNELYKRYDILRTVFLYEGVDLPLQIILKERRVEFLYKDLRKLIEKSDRESIIETIAREDRACPYDLANDILMRVVVMQTKNSQYEILWSHHHILMDGWCVGILFKEFLEIYGSFMESRTARLGQIRPYKDYIRWLMKQDHKEPGIYWEKYLENFEKATSLPKKKGVQNHPGSYRYEKISFGIDETKTAGLYTLAAGNQVTLNTVFQAIWGIILSQYNRQEDIVFGAVVSGRPPAIKGIETMIGLFINTIPVRMSCKPGATFSQLVRHVQEKAVASEPYHYYPLTRIQANSVLKGSLVDHILVFENYPLAEQLEGLVKSSGENVFTLEGFSEYTQPDYNFHLVIQPGKSINIEIRYNQLEYDRDLMNKTALHIEEVIDALLQDSDARLEETGLSGWSLKAKSPAPGHYTRDFGF